MAKAKTDPNARRSGESHFEWRGRLARQKQNERDAAEPIVPQEAMLHGDYRLETVRDVDTQAASATLVNRGGTPVARWKQAKKLSDVQIAVIDWCLRLWELAGRTERLTAQYGERIPGAGTSELRAMVELTARDELRRLEGYFTGRNAGLWGVFENVCRFDMPAGVAGGNYDSKTNQVRALFIVETVTNRIADEEGL